MIRENERITRRGFVGKVVSGAAGLALLKGATSSSASPVRTAVDRVQLGRSGVGVSRLGIGTGSNGGSVQRGLRQDGFTHLVRHALDRGITLFDTADNYNGMHEMLQAALKGVDRSKIQIQCKIPWGKYADPLAEIDCFRKEVGTDYFDTFLIHHVGTADWPEKNARLMDLLEEAKTRKWIRAHGASIHGLDPLAAATSVKWLDVVLCRVNHNGTHMDGPTGAWAEQGNRDEALGHIRKIHSNGTGIIGMKLIGNGNFADPNVREQSIRFVMGLDFVDAVVIGFKSQAEIDEAISRINNALNA